MIADPKATQFAAAEVLIESSPDIVWQVLTDFQDWPKWNPEIKKVRGDMKVEKGSVVKWTWGGVKVKATIQEVDPPNQLIWTGRLMSINAVHVWKLSPRGSRTLLRTEESWDGILAKVFRKMLQTQLEETLSSWVGSIRSESERRVAK